MWVWVLVGVPGLLVLGAFGLFILGGLEVDRDSWWERYE